MVKTVLPRGEAPVDSQAMVVGVLGTLVGDNGLITGCQFDLDSLSPQVSFGEAFGIKPLLKFFASVNRAFPNYVLNIENLVSRGEKVMAKYTLRGRLTGCLLGEEPTGADVLVTALDVFRLDRGRVAEYWSVSHKIEALD